MLKSMVDGGERDELCVCVVVVVVVVVVVGDGNVINMFLFVMNAWVYGVRWIMESVMRVVSVLNGVECDEWLCWWWMVESMMNGMECE